VATSANGVPGPGDQRRRRRHPDEARAEILAAAREVLDAGTVEDLTATAVMGRTTLSRKSFYVYFRDRSELIVALVRPLRAAADDALGRWRDADDPVAAGRAALRAAAEVYREHGTILRAVLQAPTTDPELLAARDDLTSSLVAVAEQQIRRFDSGLTDPHATAVALATMNVHVLLAQAPGASDAELDGLVETISEIWERTLIGADARG
jgi:AcrR family transcriptional regulator